MSGVNPDVVPTTLQNRKFWMLHRDKKPVNPSLTAPGGGQSEIQIPFSKNYGVWVTHGNSVPRNTNVVAFFYNFSRIVFFI